MDNALKLRVMFDMVDNWTKPLRNMLNSNKGLAQSLKATRGELAELGKQQKAVASFREMRAGLADTTRKLGAAQSNVKALAGSLHAFGPPTQKMVADLARARQAASRLRAEQKKQTAAVDEMRGRLKQAGIETRNLAQHERTLRANIASTTATMQAQTRQLEALSEREKKLAAARGKMQAMQGVAGGMAIGGYAARSTGMRVLGGLGGTLDEAKKMTNERARITALGLGDQATQDAEKYVRAMNMMGVSTSDNMTLMRDALSIFADEHHAQMVMPTLAKMKFANEALFGAEDAHANEEKFMNMLKVIELRGGTKDEATFKNEANMVQKVLSATGGRVGGDEWRNFIQTGGVAAKQMRQDAFYYQMEPLIQEMGGHGVGTGLMSAYSNVYQGKTTVRAAQEMMNLGLVDKKNVEYNKIGMIKRIKPGALLGGDLFKASPLEWLEKVLLPQMAKKGITDPDKVKDMISTIFTNRTAANLFSTMYMQRDQIHKNEKLNRGAYGIDDAAKLAALQTQGKENDLLAKGRDLRREIGERIAPLYNAALDKTREILGGLIGLIQRHGAAAKVILSVLAAFAALLVVMGTFTIVLAGILGPLAIVRFSMATLGIQGGFLARTLGASASGLGLLSGAASRFSVVGNAARTTAARMRAALAAAWSASSPRAVVSSVAQWGRTVVTSMKNGLVATRQYTAQVWRAVAAQAAASRAAVVSRWTAARQYAGNRGVAGMSVDALKGAGGLIKGGAVGAINGVGAALGGLAQMLMFVGRIALMNPVGLVITGIALAALLIIRYWEPIKAFFAGFWQGLTDGLQPLALIFSRVFGVLSAMFEPLKPAFNWLMDAVKGVWDWISRLLGPVNASRESLDKASTAGRGFGEWLANIIVAAAKVAEKMAEFGANLISGLVNGITNGLGAVKEAITNVANSTVTWFKEKLGIHSPSRVFTELGGFIGEGAALGMAGEQRGVARAALGLATAAVTGFGTPALSTAAPLVPIDRRPPITASAPAAASSASAAAPASIVINIYPQAGDDPRAIARAVAAELDRRERAQRARAGSRLSD
ncbi:tape measure protein [Burkholderia phage Momento]|uniref:Tape measure protein n=1 Tax=Burkholderia phage Momento TaxID=2924902 RepID=A0AAE9G716_9CAUD|nr:tape measure protein [Burkholderia phage Momento]